jgi:hypothetical protein
MRTPFRPARRCRVSRGVAWTALVSLAAGLMVFGSAGPASAAVPYAAACSALSEQYPTADGSYGIPIENQIVNGTLTQGATSEITGINASVCGLLQFPSLSATIPAANISYDQTGETATVKGIAAVGTVTTQASGPSMAVTSDVPAANGGLVFTLTASTANVITINLGLGIGLVSCNVPLTATLNTDPTKGGAALVGPLATGAQGTAYAPDGSVQVGALTAANPSDPVDVAGCPLVGTAIGAPTNSQASFKAPLEFYSTLTHF